MKTKALHRLCGIEGLTRPKTRTRWQTVRLKFMGAECYVLGTKYAELKLTTRGGGFGLLFKKPVKLQADQLLGNKVEVGLLVDVVMVFEESAGLPELSLASLGYGRYPHVLRKGATLSIA